jgi:hypothetical protein
MLTFTSQELGKLAIKKSKMKRGGVHFWKFIFKMLTFTSQELGKLKIIRKKNFSKN